MTTVETPYEKVRRKMVAARIEFLGQLAKFSKNELAQQHVEGEWSPLQIAHHLYITDGIALSEMRRIQEEDTPFLEDTGQLAPHATEESEPPVSLDAVLAGMAARREQVFQYLSELPNDAWVRPLRHAAWGDIKFYQFVNVLPTHDQQHTQQLAKMREGA